MDLAVLNLISILKKARTVDFAINAGWSDQGFMKIYSHNTGPSREDFDLEVGFQKNFGKALLANTLGKSST
jgi:hypothetical protein